MGGAWASRARPDGVAAAAPADLAHINHAAQLERVVVVMRAERAARSRAGEDRVDAAVGGWALHLAAEQQPGEGAERGRAEG